MGNVGSHSKLTNKTEDQDGAENETNVKIETTGSGDENVADAKEEVETPVLLKNRHHIMALVDPRSPTQEISRTPIAVSRDFTKNSEDRFFFNILKSCIQMFWFFTA